ncbi:MAG: ABC transporter substrate-binding protein [Pseudomonadota bacterium]
MRFVKWMVAAAAGAAMLAGSPAWAQQKVTVWWEKGFYKAEDDALFAMIKKFEERTKIKVDLSFYGTQEMIPKSVAALEANNPPDVAFGNVFDFQATGKWAYEGKLEDITSVIDPIRNRFEPRALSTTFLYNNAEQKRAYYAFPVRQQTMHIQYWKDMLAEAGFKESDIPKDWKGYWEFWCDKVQPAYRQKTGTRAFGTGFPMGVDSSDAFYSFLTFMDAYNVQVVSDSGKLLVDDPKVRAGLIAAMNDYTSVYAKGCTPPSATAWKDPDNNNAFHNKTTVLTHNATISIAAKWLDDMNNQSLTEAQRATARRNYTELIATAGFPNKPDGSKMVYRAAVKTGVVFKDAKNKDAAKRFVSFLLEDSNLTPYVEGSLGRWYPVTRAGQASKFWTSDPHRLIVHNQFQAGTTPFEFTKNFRFTQLHMANVWAKAMNRILSEKWTTERAIDEMIGRIKTVASN